MEDGLRTPQVESDLQVADADERNRCYVEEKQQGEVVGVFKSAGTPAFHARLHGYGEELFHHHFLAYQQIWQHRQRRQQPDPDGYSLDPSSGHKSSGSQRSPYRIEALGADHSERQDRGRDGQPLSEVDDLAHSVPVHPILVHLHRNCERHAEKHHQQVTHGQVDQERVGDGPHVAITGEDVDDQNVPYQPHDKRQAIDGHQNDRRGLFVHEEAVFDLIDHFVRQPITVCVRQETQAANVPA